MSELKILRELFIASRALSLTAPVDDDFQLVLHRFHRAVNEAEEMANTESDNINELIADAGAWAEETFPKSNELSILKHMNEEFNELIQAVTTEEKSEEAADIFLLLCHYCYKNKINLAESTHKKLDINKKRKWQTEINDKGYFNHIDT